MQIVYFQWVKITREIPSNDDPGTPGVAVLSGEAKQVMGSP